MEKMSAPKEDNVNILDSAANGTLLVDRAHAHIRDLIISGQLSAGNRLNEIELAKSLGVSRGPVREAIRRLAASGLATVLPNQGEGRSIGDETIRSLYELRESIEAMAAACAAERMTDTERKALDSMLKDHAAKLHENPSDAYPSGPPDWDFHQAVLRGSRNELAYRICAGDLRDLLALVRAGHSRSPGRNERALEEHRWIANAVIAGDADLARNLMSGHIRASFRIFMQIRDRANTTRSNPEEI
ncbi:GntR family transcriptional regulator [Ochrobactrum daejeonense]|nr:GntR family transcriptional regulator [Brucella daejeonensis]